MVVILVAAGFFAQRHMGDVLARKLEERLSEDGVFFSWRSVDWVPGSGIRLHGLALYRDAAKHDRLALFGGVTAVQSDLTTLNVKVADAQLLLGSGAAETKLEHVGLQLLVEPEKANLDECRVSLQGLRIEASGAFIKTASAGTAKEDAASRPATPGKSVFANVNLDWLKSVKEWMQIQPESAEPVLKVDFQPLPEDSGTNITMTFNGRRFRWQGQKWDFMQAAAKCSVGKEISPIEIDHLRIGYAGWKAEIAGAFDPASNVMRISKLNSEIDLLTLVHALAPNLGGRLSAASASGNWRISGAGEIPLDHPENWRWNGEVALRGDFVYASGGTKITLQKPVFAIRVEEQVVSISDFKAGLWDGSLTTPKTRIYLPSANNKLRFETQATFNGVRLQSIIESLGEVQKTLLPLNWTGTWQMSGGGEIPLDHPENSRWNGDAALDGDFVYAGGGTKITLQKPAFAIRFEEQVISISDFKSGLWDGNITAPKTRIYLPSAKNKLRFETQVALKGVRPQSVIESFGEEQKQLGALPLKWTGTWRMSGEGEIPLDHTENWRWDGDTALDGDFVYASGGTKVTLQDPAFGIRIGEKVVSISDFKAGLWQGSLAAPKTRVYLPSAKNNLRFETQLTLNGINLPSVIDSFNGAQKQPRLLPWNWTGTWRMSGEGEIPLDRPGNSRWTGDMALDGDFVYAKGRTKIALQKPAFGIRLEDQVVSLSDFKAGLWDGNLTAPKALAYLPSAKNKPRFETRITLSDAQLQSVIDSFGGDQHETGVVQFDWNGGGEFGLGLTRRFRCAEHRPGRVLSHPASRRHALLVRETDAALSQEYGVHDDGESSDCGQHLASRGTETR